MQSFRASPEAESSPASPAKVLLYVKLLLFVGGIVAVPAVWQLSCGTIGIGEFGDAVAGTTGVLWSLAGLGMIFAAFLTQQAQLKAQHIELDFAKQELAQSLEEMKQQTRLFEEQTKTLSAQRFETSFFQMLDAHEAFARDLSFFEIDVTYKGREVFTRIVSLLRMETRAMRMYEDASSLARAVTIYNTLHQQYASVLGPYFRSLFQVISWIDASAHEHLTPRDRRRYANIVRSRLSEDELAIFFYNLVSEHGSGFRTLVKKYDLLQHLPKHALLDPNHFEIALDKSAP